MQPLIELKNTTFRTDTAKKIIHSISTNIHAGDFIVVLGGNGSGKSSLLKLINRTYFHTDGDIIFKNKPIASYDFKSLRKEMVTITQFIADSLFLDLTIEENALLLDAFSKKDLFQLSDYLTQFNPRLSKLLKTSVKYLSGGEQQILAFALYLRKQPDLLLLDEPTSASDPKKADAVMSFIDRVIQEKRITCLMTTHQLDYALKYGNRLIAIREGEIVFDANAQEKKKLVLTDLLKYCY